MLTIAAMILIPLMCIPACYGLWGFIKGIK